jgi:hypothetical protein
LTVAGKVTPEVPPAQKGAALEQVLCDFAMKPAHMIKKMINVFFMVD